MMKDIFFKTIVFILLSLLLSNTALAHKVTVFAWVEGNTVYGESKFSGGRKAQGAEVIVSDLEGNRLLTAKTDQNGDFSFPVPKKTGLKIELIAGMGHKGEWTLTAEEVGTSAADAGNTDQASAPGSEVAEKPTSPAMVSESPKPEPANTAEPSALAVNSQSPGTQSAKADIPDKAELQAMIEKSLEKSLDEKLKPLIRMLADSQQKGPTVNEIVGGIGYIFGLMGLALYFKSRKEKG